MKAVPFKIFNSWRVNDCSLLKPQIQASTVLRTLFSMLNTSSGATWVSVHHGGGVGIGYSIHAGQVTVADGTDLAEKKIRRVLTNDPGIGVVRHADAGYDIAKRVAKEKGIRMPMENFEEREK